MDFKTFPLDKPEHGQSIVVFDSEFFQIHCGDVEYKWVQFDGQGPTGVYTCYEEGSVADEDETLQILFDGCTMESGDVWIDCADYEEYLLNLQSKGVEAGGQ